MFNYIAEGWKAYAIALSLVGVATMVRLIVGEYEQRISFVATYFPAILFSTLIGGSRVGIVATIIATLASWFLFMTPMYSFSLSDPGTRVNLPLFVVCSGISIWIASGYRRLVTSLKEADEHRALLIQEMRHRARNCISVASTIVDNTLKPDHEKAERVMGRLKTVLSYDQVFLDRDEAGERLRDIISEQMEPYDKQRYALEGANVVISPQDARCWALIIHELATNAAKYGALSQPDGMIKISWVIENDELALHWSECGVTADNVREPGSAPSSGFGTKLIHAMVRGLSGRIDSQITADGLQCKIHSKITTPTA